MQQLCVADQAAAVGGGMMAERTRKERLLVHADYLDRQGRRSLAADLRSVIEGLESLAVLAESHVSGAAQVAPQAIALAARKFLEAEAHGRLAESS